MDIASASGVLCNRVRCLPMAFLGGLINDTVCPSPFRVSPFLFPFFDNYRPTPCHRVSSLECETGSLPGQERSSNETGPRKILAKVSGSITFRKKVSPPLLSVSRWMSLTNICSTTILDNGRFEFPSMFCLSAELRLFISFIICQGHGLLIFMENLRL